MGTRFSRKQRNGHPQLTHQINFEFGIPEIPAGEVEKLEAFPSGTGGLGDVWKCYWSRPSEKCNVAVKAVRENDGMAYSVGDDIENDASVWITLAHDNILIYHGIIKGFGLLPALVSPWMENGSLDRYLKQGYILSKADKLRMLREIAAGLEYLHGRGVVHGDLTSGNVLIKDDGELCLAYFGISGSLIEAEISPFDDCDPSHVRWMAPEMLAMPEQEEEEIVIPTKAADVYSYGCIMLQLMCERVPYCWLMQPFNVIAARVAGIEPFRQLTDVEEIQKDYSLECLSANPRYRPDACGIVEFLEAH
ncbi:kinase-like protein [Suillus decipiens]|nr:kinase-like protein [Suillus decipiens]